MARSGDSPPAASPSPCARPLRQATRSLRRATRPLRISRRTMGRRRRSPRSHRLGQMPTALPCLVFQRFAATWNLSPSLPGNAHRRSLRRVLRPGLRWSRLGLRPDPACRQDQGAYKENKGQERWPSKKPPASDKNPRQCDHGMIPLSPESFSACRFHVVCQTRPAYQSHQGQSTSRFHCYPASHRA